MIKIPKAVIKAMPYNQRLRNYEAEKNELLQKMRDFTVEEFAEKLKALANKWMV